jgi:CP family cyanate transporter-like MFS transporter
MSAVGPLGMGLLYGLTGGWTVPLLVLLGLCVAQLFAGMAVARPSYIEDAVSRVRPD